jgi:ligand-binding sensor domain-containing protein
MPASQIIVDDEDQKWIVSPRGNGLIVFNDNKTIDNAADDKWKLYRSGAGIGNLPTNNVLSIAKDKSGFIWIGTKRWHSLLFNVRKMFFHLRAVTQCGLL